MVEDKDVGQVEPIKTSFGVAKHALLYSKRFARRLAERKEAEALEAESHTNRQLRPDALNLIHLIALGLGGTIGTGIFVLSGEAAALYAGPSVIISFILSGIVALLSALSYAEMSSMLSTSGSAYTYVYIALGEYPAFVIGWTSTLLYQLAASVVAVSWSEYVVHFINTISNYNASRWIVEAPVAWGENDSGFYVTGQIINLPSIAIVIFITIILFLGIRETSMVNLVLVIFKVIVLLIFIFAGCVYVKKENYRPFFPPNQGMTLSLVQSVRVTGMIKASTYVFFAYVGFETVSTVTKEAKKPAKYIPYATVISLLITLLLYVGVCTVMVGLVPYTMLDQVYPIEEAVKGTPYGIWLSVLLDLGAIASLTTVAITVLLTQIRILYAMARDGLLPPFFARIHNRRRTPWVTTIICGVICMILSGVCPVDIIGEITSIGALTTFFLVHVSVIVMRFTHKYLPRGFRVPYDPFVIPLVGGLLCILLMIPVSRATGIRYGIWMGVGHIVYFSYGFWFSRVRQERLQRTRASLNNLVPRQNVFIVDLDEQEPAPSTKESDTESDKETCF